MLFKRLKKVIQTFCLGSIFFEKENIKTFDLPRSGKARAFTLIELLVVIGIVGIMTSIIMYDYGKFSSNLVVTNLAYESALAVREAQVYGISVKQTKGSVGIDTGFDASYGVSFAYNNGADIQNFYLFADKDVNNKRRLDGTEDEESFGTNGSNKISKFCVTDSSNVNICSGPAGQDLAGLSVIFKRPSTEALIYGIDSVGSLVNYGLRYPKAQIMFTSGRGDKTARMIVTNTGQISIDSCSATNICP